MALNDRVGPQLPGSDNEQFNYGLDYSGLVDSDAAIPGMPSQVLPNDANMGALSMPVGLGGDTDNQFGNVELFDNPVPGYDISSQFDSMAQLPTDSHIETLVNESMYGSQVEQPFVEVEETATALIGPDEPEGQQ
jgi:hypothetical protein